MAAVQAIRTARGAEGLGVDKPWLQRVRATVVLRHGTPVNECQLFAGDHQCAQGDLVPLGVAHFLRLAVESPPELPLANRVLLAHQKAGWPRPLTTVC